MTSHGYSHPPGAYQYRHLRGRRSGRQSICLDHLRVSVSLQICLLSTQIGSHLAALPSPGALLVPLNHIHAPTAPSQQPPEPPPTQAAGQGLALAGHTLCLRCSQPPGHRWGGWPWAFRSLQSPHPSETFLTWLGR